MESAYKIVPVPECGDNKTGSLSHRLTPQDIADVLGFASNCEDDIAKVKYSWGFTINGVRCGIWDYKGSRWSVFDPNGVLEGLFSEKIKSKGGA